MKAVILLGTIALSGVSAAAGAATASSEIQAILKLVVDDFNKNDMKALGSLMSPDVVVVDDVSPHIWTAPNAFDTWDKALDAYEQAQGITDDLLTAAKPTRMIVAGDRAYIVQPMSYTFKQKNVPMQESSRMVYSLQKGTGGWLITSFTWAGGAPKPVADAARK
jgi:ketosteroid isomerase-like protein